MIVFDERGGTISLHTRRTTYQMKADQRGVLLHLYYGPRVEAEDLSYLTGASPRLVTRTARGMRSSSSQTP